MELSGAERERYGRQMPIEGWGLEGQRRLKEACVFIAGAGGLGSPAAAYLAAAGVGRLRLCDDGSVEPSNLNRQILHGETSLGLCKAASARRRLLEINPLLEVSALEGRLSPESVDSLAGGACLLLDCLDNWASRRVLNAFALRRGLPLLHAAVQGLCGRVAFFHPPGTPCLECVFPGGGPGGIVPVAGAAAGAVGSLQALEAIKFLLGARETLSGGLVFFDGESLELRRMGLRRDPSCPACGGSPAKGRAAPP